MLPSSTLFLRSREIHRARLTGAAPPVVGTADAPARRRRGHDRRQGRALRRAAAPRPRGAPRQGQPAPAAGLGRAGRRGGAPARRRGDRRAARGGRRGGRRLRPRPPGRVGARVGRRDRRAAQPDRRLAGQALAGGARPDGRPRGGDPVAQRPPLRPLLLGREARVAARERGGGAACARRRDAPHGHRGLVPVRPPRRGLRDRQLDGLAHAAPPARHARLRRSACASCSASRPTCSPRCATPPASWARSGTSRGRASCGCAARWWTSRRRSPARAASCPGASRPPTAPASSCSATWATRCRAPPAASCRRWRGASTAAWSTRSTAASSPRARCSSGCAASSAWRRRPPRSPSSPAARRTTAARACSRGSPAWARRGGSRTPAPCSPACTAARRARTSRSRALEGIAWRVADVVAAMRESAEVDSLRVDGGLTNEPLLLQLQADAIGVRVDAAGADATVLGAAALGAVGAGVIGSLAEAAELLPIDRSVEPQQDDDWRTREHERWKAFVRGAVELRRSRRARAAASAGRRLVDVRRLLLGDAHALVELDRPDRALVALVHPREPGDGDRDDQHAEHERREVGRVPVERIVPPDGRRPVEGQAEVDRGDDHPGHRHRVEPPPLVAQVPGRARREALRRSASAGRSG